LTTNKRPILEVFEVSKGFGGIAAVNEVSFSVFSGELVGLIGPNGAGKTTLFNIVSGFLKPDKGIIKFGDRDITGIRADIISRLGIARTFQIPQIFGKLSLLQSVMVGFLVRRLSPLKAREEASRILTMVGLADKAELKGNKLNVIDKKRLELAKALSLNPTLLLIDEVMGGLTPLETEEASVIINKIRSVGTTIIFIEHAMDVVMSISDRIIVFNQGRKISEGSPKHVCNNRQVIQAYLGGED